MKIYKTQSEVEKDIKNNVLAIEGDVCFECPISISASIEVTGNINARDINARDINARDITALDINAWDINAGNINARNITAGNINAGDITAGDITAGDIDARDINAGNINARNIDAGDITAWNITAGDILYHAFCCVYQSIKCLSIKAKREIHQEPICLDGKVEIKKTELDDKTKEAIELLKKNGYKIVKN